MKTVGQVLDAGGAPGINRALFDDFLAGCKARLAWQREVAVADDDGRSSLLHLGVDTNLAYAAYAAIRHKVDEFFALCHLEHHMPGSFTPPRMVLGAGGDLLTGGGGAGDKDHALCALPLAAPNSQGVLDLGLIANPLFVEAIESFARMVVGQLHPQASGNLDQTIWKAIGKVMAPQPQAPLGAQCRNNSPQDSSKGISRLL